MFPGHDAWGKQDPTTILNGLFSVRKKFTVAEINAGAELLPARPGQKYRLVDARAIAIGGAASAALNINGTQATAAAKLVAFASAQLTQNTVLRAGAAGAAVLAGGASFDACDAGTAVTVAKDAGDVGTATHVEICALYAIDE